MTRGVRGAIARAHAAVRAVAAEAKAEQVAQFGATVDAERLREMGPDAALVLMLNAGTAEQSEMAIEGGWRSEKQHKFGELNTVYEIEIQARDDLTAEVMNQADRLKLNDVLYQFNFDPPGGEPRVWTLYATEMKAGGIR